jgi:hypothetical protein
MRFARLVTVLVLTLGLVTVSQAADSNWTEVDVTVFDRIDGNFAPRLTGAVMNFINGKGVGAFLGEDNAIGPIMAWRVWMMPFGDFDVSIFTLASSDVSGTADGGSLLNNGSFGLEPRVHWDGFGNADVALGVLNWQFEEGEKATWAAYVKLAFRP